MQFKHCNDTNDLCLNDNARLSAYLSHRFHDSWEPSRLEGEDGELRSTKMTMRVYLRTYHIGFLMVMCHCNLCSRKEKQPDLLKKLLGGIQ